MTRSKRLAFERLEGRRLLVGDLEIVSVDFTNALGVLTGSTPVVGEKIYARVHYRATGLTGGENYNISWDLDGVTTEQFNFQGVPGTNVDLFWYHGGWIAEAGASHSLTVTLDSGLSVAETNEGNNSITLSPFTPLSPTTLPAKFALPLAGTQNVDWVLGGYVDVNPKSFFDDPLDYFEDYQGNTVSTRDFHNGLDFDLVNFAAQDSDVQVLAAAAGTVVEVRDSQFDRETGLTFGDPGNYVFIDHGNGWVSQYYHLREDSATVAVNDVVSAGDVLGLVGSSGNSGGPHVHFEIQYNQTPVDPFAAPSDYFLSPPTYVFDSSLPNNLIDLVVTNDIYDGVSTYGSPPLFGGPPLEQVREQVSGVEVFPATNSEPIIVYAEFTSVEAGDTWEAQLFDPFNTLYFDYDAVVFATDRPTDGGWFNPGFTFNSPGTWRVDILYNGVKVGEETFTVGSDAPEMRVFDATLSEEMFLIDGRATDIEFGAADFDGDNIIGGLDFLAWQRNFGTTSFATRADGDANKDGAVNGEDLEIWQAEAGQTEPTKTFRVENHGYGNLTISSVTLPTGFAIVEGLDASIAPGASDTFTVKLESGVAGYKSGQIVINSNDGDEAAFSFDVEGTVSATLAIAAEKEADVPNSVEEVDFVYETPAELQPILEVPLIEQPAFAEPIFEEWDAVVSREPVAAVESKVETGPELLGRDVRSAFLGINLFGDSEEISEPNSQRDVVEAFDREVDSGPAVDERLSKLPSSPRRLQSLRVAEANEQEATELAFSLIGGQQEEILRRRF